MIIDLFRMEFADSIASPKIDGVMLHSPFHDPVDGTLCITGHHLILSSRKEDVQELWVGYVNVNMIYSSRSYCHKKFVVNDLTVLICL